VQTLEDLNEDGTMRFFIIQQREALDDLPLLVCDPPLPPCRFCGAASIGVYAFDEGCLCYPDDREQALCPQHVVRATPLEGMRLLRGPGMP
jgi:hypothetical protein